MLQKTKRIRKTPIIIANWKMAPGTIREAQDVFAAIRAKTARFSKNTIVVCPPALFFGSLREAYKGKNFLFGVQDCFYEDAGSFTGKISAVMARGAGAQAVIIGHSEMRRIGDTQEIVEKKLRAALRNDLIPVLCIGEEVRDDEGRYLEAIRQELQSAIKSVPRSEASKLIIGYEPVWAIGGVRAMEPHDIHQMVIFIRKLLIEQYGKEIAAQIPILYGGSVSPENARAIITKGHVKGFVLGRPSTDPGVFVEIVKNISA